MKVALKILLWIGVLSVAGVFGWMVFRPGGVAAVLILGEKARVPDKVKYEVLAGELERWRLELSEKYSKARTAGEREAVEHDARVVLELVMPEMMRCWLGTEYDFNGTAEKPGEGKVACGYFVSTVIRDAGFRVNRYKLAQQPSENIMRTFLPGDACLLKVGEDFETYADRVQGMEPGVYIIGLDTHVGFIVNEGDGVIFYHSSGAGDRGVVEENRKSAGAIRNSKWRMIGGLTADAGVIRTWLGGGKVKVRR